MLTDYERASNAALAANLKICGIRFKRGKWRVFVDDDDLPSQSYLESRLQNAGAVLQGFGVAINRGGYVDFILEDV